MMPSLATIFLALACIIQTIWISQLAKRLRRVETIIVFEKILPWDEKLSKKLKEAIDGSRKS